MYMVFLRPFLPETLECRCSLMYRPFESSIFGVQSLSPITVTRRRRV